MVLIKRPIGSPDVWNCALTPACPSQGRLRREAEGTREPLKDPWAAEAEEAERSPRTAAGPLGLGAPFPGPAAEAGRERGGGRGPCSGGAWQGAQMSPDSSQRAAQGVPEKRSSELVKLSPGGQLLTRRPALLPGSGLRSASTRQHELW